MVLWEITLATAYFLGIKRSYKLALRLQRRLISLRYLRLRDFAHRRTRNVFDIALTVHKKIQERDIEVGRNVGNWILRCLDRMKPSAHIRGDSPSKLIASEARSTGKTVGDTPSTGVNSTNGQQLSADRESGRSLYVTSKPLSRTDNGHFVSLLKYREKGGFRLNSGVGTRSLPHMTHNLFRQPVRQNLRALVSCTDVSFGASHTSQFYSKHFSRGVIREDIAAWMRQ